MAPLALMRRRKDADERLRGMVWNFLPSLLGRHPQTGHEQAVSPSMQCHFDR